MAVAFDAFSVSSIGDDPSWTHTPVGTPRAALVYVLDVEGTDSITGVTYGGSACTRVAIATRGSAPLGDVYLYFLGSSVPTGAQTVAVTTAGGAVALGYAITLTAAANTEVVDSDNTINSGTATDPSVTLSLGGRTCFASNAFYSGHDATTGVTPLASWTARDESDIGSEVMACYTYDTIGTTDVTAGWTQTSEVALAVTAAVSEVQATTSIIPQAMQQYRRRRVA